MRNYFLTTIILFGAMFAGCNKDNFEPVNFQNEKISLLDGAIFINNYPNVAIDEKSMLLDNYETFSAGAKSASKSELTANDYRFRLVAQMGALTVNRNGTDYKAQASHVKMSDDGYVFVSYNHRGEPNIGGLVVYKYTVSNGKFKTVKVNLTAVTSIEMPMAQINSIDFDGNKLYLAGANQDPKLGYKGRNPAFFMVMELDANKKFKPVEPNTVQHLTSYQATSIRKYRDRIYITTGDGTNGTQGGMYVYNANDYSAVNFVEKQHARSVDADESGVYLMQANHARITKYDYNGGGETEIYNVSGEAMQKDAKSEILAWDKYILSAQNESGLRMLLKENGNEIDRLNRPGSDPENEVTNSVSMNSDIKRTVSGRELHSNLLLLANGAKGVYWYDIMTNEETGKDEIVAGKRNSILGGSGSANFITSKGNIAFVADGLGGLKVLYIGFYTEKDNGDDGSNDPDCKVVSGTPIAFYFKHSTGSNGDVYIFETLKYACDDYVWVNLDATPEMYTVGNGANLITSKNGHVFQLGDRGVTNYSNPLVIPCVTNGNTATSVSDSQYSYLNVYLAKGIYQGISRDIVFVK